MNNKISFFSITLFCSCFFVRACITPESFLSIPAILDRSAVSEPYVFYNVESFRQKMNFFKSSDLSLLKGLRPYAYTNIPIVLQSITNEEKKHIFNLPDFPINLTTCKENIELRIYYYVAEMFDLSDHSPFYLYSTRFIKDDEEQNKVDLKFIIDNENNYLFFDILELLASAKVLVLKFDDYFEEYKNNLCIYSVFANLGVVYAQLAVGKLYIKMDKYKSARHFFELASMQNSSIGQYELGMIYYEGLGIRKNIAKSVNLFKESSKRGNCKAQYQLGTMLKSGEGIEKNLNEAFKYLEEAATSGDPWAQKVVAQMLYDGEGVEKDLVKALSYFKMAAEKGLTSAFYEYAMMIKNGEGCSQDLNSALKAFKRLASSGHVEAKYQCGLLLYDWAKQKIIDCHLFLLAFKFFKSAAYSNHVESLFYCGLMLYNKEVDSLMWNKKAFWFFKSAADLFYEDAIFYVGKMYFEGSLIKQNYIEAFESFRYLFWLDQNIEATYYCGLMYFDGLGVKQSYKISLGFFERLMDKNDPRGFWHCGLIYEKGLSEVKNEALAFEYFKNVLSFECDLKKDAYYKCGLMLEDGNGIDKDVKKAREYFQIASDLGSIEAKSYLKTLKDNDTLNNLQKKIFF